MNTAAAWPVKRMRFLVNRQPSVQQRRLLREAEQVTFLPMEAIGEDGVIDSSKVRDKDDASDGYTQFFDGDILVAKICFKNKVGLEIEWNNKDPFFDRDLNNFRLLFELRAVSVGVIVTRCDELQTIFNRLGKGKSYGNSTTHMSKLLPRLNGGGGGGCPILVFGIRERLYVEDVPDSEADKLRQEFTTGRKSKWQNIGSTLARYIPVNTLRKTPIKEEEEE